MKKYLFTLCVLLSATLFGSAIEAPKEAERINRASLYIGGYSHWLADANIMVGVQTRYLDIPIF